MLKTNTKKRVSRRHFYMAFTACAMLFLSVAGLLWINEAQAVRVSMKRIIFEGPKRSDIVTIMNNSAKEQSYRLGWRRYRMDEKKSLIHIDDKPEEEAKIKWADDMIRFAPRRVTVPPGGSQQVRVLLRRPRDLEPAEYRAHLWIVTEEQARDFEPDGQGTGQTSFKLTMMPALTMPIFVRHGDLEASAKITDLKVGKVDAEHNEISLVLHREGTRSLYGDLKVTCSSGYVARQIRGIAVYPEVAKRFLTFDVKVPAERASECSSVRVEYIADKNDSLYAGKVMASMDASM